LEGAREALVKQLMYRGVGVRLMKGGVNFKAYDIAFEILFEIMLLHDGCRDLPARHTHVFRPE
jgi:hypothetical protein